MNTGMHHGGGGRGGGGRGGEGGGKWEEVGRVDVLGNSTFLSIG